MAGFIEFDEYLAEPFPVDNWEDDAIGYAQQLIAGLAPAGWEVLESVWVSRPVSWQVRAAQVLSHGLSMYAVPLLLCMTESKDLDVVEAAADSLRDFGALRRPPTVSTVRCVRAHSARGTRWVRRVTHRRARR
jgi:hypothetical protein